MNGHQRVYRSIIARTGLIAVALLAVSGQARPSAHALASRSASPRIAAVAPVVLPLAVPDAGIVRPGADAILLIPRPSGVAGYVPISVTVSLTGTTVASFDGKVSVTTKRVTWTSAPGASAPTLAIHVLAVANGAAFYTVVADAANRRFVGQGTIYVGSTLQPASRRLSVGTGYMTRLNLTVAGALPRLASPAVLIVTSADPKIASVVSYVPVTLTVAQPVVPVFITANRIGATTLTVQTGVAVSNTATISGTGTLLGSMPLSNTVALQPGTVLSTTVTLKVVPAGPPPAFILQTNPISVTGNFALASPSQVACGSAPANYDSPMMVTQLGDLFIMIVPSDSGAVNVGGINPDGSFAIQRNGESYTGRIDRTGSGYADNSYGYKDCAWKYHVTFTPLATK